MLAFNENGITSVCYLLFGGGHILDELAKLINISQRGIEKNVRMLQDNGSVRRVGPAKGEHWEVVRVTLSSARRPARVMFNTRTGRSHQICFIITIYILK